MVRYLDELLGAAVIKDYCPNGWQVEGAPTVRRAVCAVTASLAVVRAAAARGADALLVHHGYFWRGEDPRVLGVRRARLRALLSADINLIAYHLPLDLHAEFGNNASLGAVMGWPIAATGGEHGLIALADLPALQSAADLRAALTTRLGREPLLVGALERPIRRIGWCTGAAQDLLEAAIDLGVDAFVSGEISERTTHLAREAGVVYAAAGHHATERFGIQALARHLTDRFGVPVEFIDDPNPV
ncbi:MAG: Nif3-like dinuclear metal center hexameric protein [Lautropia sp.]